MTRSFDAIVVGAGFAGAATAYHLTQHGLRNLLLLEREDEPGLHASGRNAALAFQQLSNGVEAKLAAEGRAFMAQPPPGFTDAPLLRPCGSLLLASEAGAARLTETAEASARLGLESHALTRAEACRLVPLLASSEFSEARWTPSDGVVDIALLLRAYLDAARGAGAEVRYGVEVEAVESTGGRVRSVRTSAGRFESPLLINGAGAWASEVGRAAGVGTRTLAPRRRHMFRLEAEAGIDPSWPFVWHDEVDVYFRPDSGGLLTSPCDAVPHPPQAPEVDPAITAVLRDKLQLAFPPLAQARIVTSWACLRTFTADELFLIGPDPELEGLVWVAGLGGHGMTTSPAVGRLGAMAALGRHTPELEPFSPARFEGKVRKERWG